MPIIKLKEIRPLHSRGDPSGPTHEASGGFGDSCSLSVSRRRWVMTQTEDPVSRRADTSIGLKEPVNSILTIGSDMRLFNLISHGVSG